MLPIILPHIITMILTGVFGALITRMFRQPAPGVLTMILLQSFLAIGRQILSPALAIRLVFFRIILTPLRYPGIDVILVLSSIISGVLGSALFTTATTLGAGILPAFAAKFSFGHFSPSI